MGSVLSFIAPGKVGPSIHDGSSPSVCPGIGGQAPVIAHDHETPKIYVEPVVRVPMQAGSRGEAWHKRSCDITMDRPSHPHRAKRRRSENMFVRCRWPGCCERMEEIRIHKDGRAYTLNDFAWHYSQRAARSNSWMNSWSDAPIAAAYCDKHLQQRASIFEELAVTSPQHAASSNWLQMHPEDEQTALDAILAWWEESKKLYADEHPLEPQPNDARLTIVNVYRIANKHMSAKQDRYQYKAYNQDGRLACNRRLLVHGTRQANLKNILSQDLKLAGLEVDSCHGSVLGCGAYFADCFLKSLQYSEESIDSGLATKLLLLVEVNLGTPLVFSYSTMDNKDVFEDGAYVTRPEITAARGRRYFRCTKLVQSEWLDGCLLPCDPSDQVSDKPATFFVQGLWRELRFNEWVVQDSSLYRVRYLVQLKRDVQRAVVEPY